MPAAAPTPSAAFTNCIQALPLIVVLTGTDVYRDIHRDQKSQRSLEIASRLVVLQKMALSEIPKRLQQKTRVIYQSAEADPASLSRATTSLMFASSAICATKKIRLRAAMAVRDSPADIAHPGHPYRSIALIRDWKKAQSRKSDAIRAIVGSASCHMEKPANAWRGVSSSASRRRWKAAPTFCRRRWHRGCRLWRRRFQA